MASIQKILTKKDKDKKTKRNQLIIGIILVGLMVFSTAGYALINQGESSSGSSSSQSFNYNGISFIKNNDYWQFSYGGYNYITTYSPQETADINVSNYFSLSDLTNQPLYFVGQNDAAVGELASNLNNQVLRAQRACLSGQVCNNNYPIKDCTSNIIVIQDSALNASSSIYKTNNCIFIVTNSTEQVRYADALLYKTLGI